MTREELREAVAQAISNAWDSEQRIFEAADAAIALVLEEAARDIKETLDEHGDPLATERALTAIRALGEKP